MSSDARYNNSVDDPGNCDSSQKYSENQLTLIKCRAKTTDATGPALTSAVKVIGKNVFRYRRIKTKADQQPGPYIENKIMSP